MLDGLGIDPAPPRLRTVVRGWVAFTEEVTVSWLSSGDLERDAIISLLDDALVALMTGVTGAWPLGDGDAGSRSDRM